MQKLGGNTWYRALYLRKYSGSVEQNVLRGSYVSNISHVSWESKFHYRLRESLLGYISWDELFQNTSWHFTLVQTLALHFSAHSRTTFQFKLPIHFSANTRTTFQCRESHYISVQTLALYFSANTCTIFQCKHLHYILTWICLTRGGYTLHLTHRTHCTL
jgi:hypothetical protein